MDGARAARRELALVLLLAAAGVALALLVALMPWYESMSAGAGHAAVVETYPPIAVNVAGGQDR